MSAHPGSNASAFEPSKGAKGGRVGVGAALLLGGVVANVCTLVLHWPLLPSILLGLLIAYLPSYFDGAQFKVTRAEGSRYWPELAHWRGWAWIMSYFPSSIVVDGAEDPNSYDFAAAAKKGGQWVFAVHPHGMLSVDHALIFTDCVGFMSRIAPVPRRDLGASVIFSLPVLRELCLWLGVVDAGARTAHKILSSGYSMQLYPGGIQEQIATNSDKPVVVAKHRGGFVKLALAYNVPIVPVYVFGEDKLYTSVSFLRRFRQKLVSVLRVGVPLFYGRLDSFGLLPHARPLCAVVGQPIWPPGVSPLTQQRDAIEMQKALKEMALAPVTAGKPPKGAAAAAAASPASPTSADGSVAALPTFVRGRRAPREPTKEEVTAMLDRYVEALGQLFEKHKQNHPGYENSTLEILSASR